MTQPNQKPIPKIPVNERHHSDPPGLWATVILSSLVIHLFTFGMLRLWLMVRLNSFQATRLFIPVDVIAEASEDQIPLQPTPGTTSTSTPNPPPVNPATNPIANTQSSSTSVRSNSPLIRNTDTSSTKNPSKEGTVATNSPKTNPAPNQSPQTPTPSRSPTPNPSNNQPSGTPTSPTNPNLPGNNGNPTNGSTPSPSPRPTASTGSSAEQNSSNSKPGGGFIIALGRLEPVSNAQDVLHVNEGDKLATCPSDNRPLPKDNLTALGISLDKALLLKVEVLIDNRGKATLLRLPPQALPQNLSTVQAEQLAKKFVERQRCTPTQMAGQPVYRDYNLTLTISPAQN